MRSTPRQAENHVIRAAAMPLVATMDAMPDAPWIGGTAGTAVNYASAKLGTQSYEAGSLTTTKR